MANKNAAPTGPTFLTMEDAEWEGRAGRTAKPFDETLLGYLEASHERHSAGQPCVVPLKVTDEKHGDAVVSELRRIAKGINVTVRIQRDVFEDGSERVKFYATDRIKKPGAGRRKKVEEPAA